MTCVWPRCGKRCRLRCRARKARCRWRPLSSSAADHRAAERAGAAGDTTVLDSEKVHRAAPRVQADNGTTPPALHPHRQHLKFDPVRHFAHAQLLVEHVLADAVPPRQPLAVGIAVERVEVARRRPSCRSRRRRSLPRSAACRCGARSPRFRAADIPDDTARPRRPSRWCGFPPLCTADTALVASTVAPGAQRLDLVEMHGRRVEHVGLADIHRMLAAGFGQPDAAAEADLAALRVVAHAAAGRRREHLQAPAASRKTACRSSSAARTRSTWRVTSVAAVVDMQRRAGDGDAVIAFQRRALGQRRRRVARIADVDDRRPAAARAAGRNSPCWHGVPPAATCSAVVCGELPSMTSRRGEGIGLGRRLRRRMLSYVRYGQAEAILAIAGQTFAALSHVNAPPR